MHDLTFGNCLRMFRQAHEPSLTQEQLAIAIERSKMTVCQFEQEKNAPPQGELLDKVINALELSEEDGAMLRFLAAKQRKALPTDVESYFFENPAIYDVIRIAKQNKISNEYWEKLVIQLGEKNE